MSLGNPRADGTVSTGTCPHCGEDTQWKASLDWDGDDRRELWSCSGCGSDVIYRFSLGSAYHVDTKEIFDIEPDNPEHVIQVTIEGGALTDVTGLPEGWTYRLLDLDNTTECELCHQSISSVGGELLSGPDDKWICPVCYAEETIECRNCHKRKYIHGPNGENLLGTCPYCKQPTPELAQPPTGPDSPTGPAGN